MSRKRRLRKVDSAQDFQMQEYDSVQYAVSDDIVAYMRGMSIRMRLSDGSFKNIKISLNDDGVWGYNRFETEEEKQAFKTAVEVVFPSGIKVLENMDYYGIDCPVSATTITLPYTLEKVGQEIFKTCVSLTSIVIPNSVTEIGTSAFGLCTGLSSVTMSNNIEHIGDEAFRACGNLTSIDLSTNASTLQLGDNVFYACSNLRSVTLPESLVEVGSGCFERCGITSIEIPSTLTTIPYECFRDCSSLSSVTLNEGLETIGLGAFWGCTSLTEIVVPDSVTDIDEHAFPSNARIIYNGNLSGYPWGGQEPPLQVRLINSNGVEGFADFEVDDNGVWDVSDNISNYSEDGNIKQFIVPEGVSGITNSNDSYCPCEYLNVAESIVLPQSLTSIGSYSFNSCEMVSINIPNGVTYIGNSTFQDCTHLSGITIPNGITQINYDTFLNCSSLEIVNLPNSVTQIGESAFRNCNALTSINIPSNITQIHDLTFYGCGHLQEVNLPSGLTSIGIGAFTNCTSLTSITIPDSVSDILSDAFYGCQSLQSITLPSNLTGIEDGTFAYCSSLTSITIPDSVSNISPDAFYNCTNLSEIHWNNQVYSYIDFNTEPSYGPDGPSIC